MGGLEEIIEELLDDGHRHRRGHGYHDEPCDDAPCDAPAHRAIAARRCAACAAPLPRGAQFCADCGSNQGPAEAGWSCFLCGQALPPGARFCPGCGNAVS